MHLFIPGSADAQTLGEVATETIIWWPVVPGILVPKIIFFNLVILRVTIDNVRDL